MKRLIITATVTLAVSQACAADLTLNDLPGILLKLRGCTETSSFLSGKREVCAIDKGDLWASVSSDGSLTLFKKRSYGDVTYAHGGDVSGLLRDFASQLNRERSDGQQMLDALAPYLETQ